MVDCPGKSELRNSRGDEKLPGDRPVRSSELSPLVIIFWLALTVIVGAVGCIMLDRGQVGAPLPLSRALPLVLGLEILVYLAALLAGGRALIPAGRVALGIVLGLVIRATISVVVAQLSKTGPGQEGMPTWFGLFGYYYVQYWPGALVQVLAVTVFLWFIRDVWEVSESRWAVREDRQPFRAGPETAEDPEVRREELLTALMEGPEEEEVAPAGPEPEREQLELESAITQMPAAEVERPGTAEKEEDTSPIPVVIEGEPVQAVPDQQVPQPTGAEELVKHAVGPEAVAGTVALTGGGGLIWAAPASIDEAGLNAAAGQLIDSSQLMSEVVRMGPMQLVVTLSEGGCWVFGPIPEAPPGWWLGLAQAAPVTVAAATVALRNIQASWPVAELTGSRTIPPMQPEIGARAIEYSSAGVIAELAEQWRSQVAIVAVADQTALVIGAPGLSSEAVAPAGLLTWQAAIDLQELLGWEEPSSVLIGLSEGAVALGRPPTGPQRPVLIVTNRDSSQVAPAALRLDKLRREFPVAERDGSIQEDAGEV